MSTASATKAREKGNKAFGKGKLSEVISAGSLIHLDVPVYFIHKVLQN